MGICKSTGALTVPPALFVTAATSSRLPTSAASCTINTNVVVPEYRLPSTKLVYGPPIGPAFHWNEGEGVPSATTRKTAASSRRENRSVGWVITAGLMLGV